MYTVIISVLAVAISAAHAQAYYGYNFPVAGHHYNGAPLDTPEVQAAKLQHFAAHAAARNGHHQHFAAPVTSFFTAAHHHAAAPISFVSTAHPAGAVHHPADTAEVAAAKLKHYHDYAVAAHRNGVHVAHPAAPAFTLAAAAAPYHHGVPVDTPEVQLAKTAHFAAHQAAALGHHGVAAHYRKRRAIYGPAAAAAYHVPVIGPHGVPVETPEVQHAKAAHFAAHAAAAAGSHFGGGVHLAPVETPEVQLAKQHHFAAHAQAAAHNGHYAFHHHHHQPAVVYGAPYAAHYFGHYYQPHAVIGHDGQPLETPEVQAAKAAHFAAHAQALHHY